MNETLTLIIAMSISALIFMSISVKFQWSKKVWAILNKKINPKFNVAIWILFSGIYNICLQLICEMLRIPFSRILLGISLGFYLAFIPTLYKEKQD